MPVRGVALLLAAAATAAVAASATSAARAGTAIHLYRPFAGSKLAPGIRVSRRASGYCWTSSIADARGDAFRCFVGNVIHDPCFAGGARPSPFVLCPLYLPTSKVLRIGLTRPLPANSSTGDPTHRRPWVLQTSSGRWCEALTGATGEVAGKPIGYACTVGGLLAGSIRRGSPTWTVLYASGWNATSFRRVGVRAAWW